MGLATAWQIAGRHHDPCEGTTLNLLSIVHVACRLADALGYDVVKPLAPLDFDTVLAELPAGRVKLGQSTFRARHNWAHDGIGTLLRGIEWVLMPDYG